MTVLGCVNTCIAFDIDTFGHYVYNQRAYKVTRILVSAQVVAKIKTQCLWNLQDTQTDTQSVKNMFMSVLGCVNTCIAFDIDTFGHYVYNQRAYKVTRILVSAQVVAKIKSRCLWKFQDTQTDSQKIVKGRAGISVDNVKNMFMSVLGCVSTCIVYANSTFGHYVCFPRAYRAMRSLVSAPVVAKIKSRCLCNFSRQTDGLTENLWRAKLEYLPTVWKSCLWVYCLCQRLWTKKPVGPSEGFPHWTHMTRIRPCCIQEAFPLSQKDPWASPPSPNNILGKEHPRQTTTQGIQKNMSPSQMQPRASKKILSPVQKNNPGRHINIPPCPKNDRRYPKNIPVASTRTLSTKKRTLPVSPITLVYPRR